jgi:hypothetical protein
MAEALSIQMAKLAGTPPSKLQANERHGVSRIMFAQITSISGQIGDTIYFGRIPVGARILAVRINNAAGTASSTLALGLRRTDTKVVINATGLAAATSIAAAASADVTATGALLNAGQTYETPTEVDVYGTIAGAVTPVSPGQLISVTVHYAVD